MMTQAITTAFGAILMLSSLVVHAEPLDVRLGLWETTTTTDVSGMPIPSDVLNKLPPERRARFEAAMKARQAHGPKSYTGKTCMTKEDLNRPFTNKDDKDKNCTSTIVTATRTHAEYRIECTGAEAHSGVMQIEALSPEQVKATMTMNTGNGAVTNELSSKWIGADCGNVR
jgi:hypothetical protein